MSNQVKPLCLSFWTPPLVRPQSILIGKMIPEWKRQGLEPVVITYDVCGKWEIDTPVYQLSPFKMNKYLKKISFADLILEKKHYQKMFNFAKDIIAKHDLNIVFSFANPQDSNILGAMLKEKLGIKFVSHFSDPWYDNPYKSYSKRQRKRVLKMEENIIKNSDKVVFTNSAAIELVMKKYPSDWRKKTVAISHSYNLKDYPSVKSKNHDKFIVSHIGALNELRNPGLLLEVLSKLSQEVDLDGKVELRLIGAGIGDTLQFTSSKIKDLADGYGLGRLVNFLPFVDYQESLKQMKIADCLVVIDADIANSPFLPSKLIDYIASGTNVVGITPFGSPTDKILKKLGCFSFNYSQADDLKKHLKKIIFNRAGSEINKEFLNEFDIRHNTTKLINHFKELLL